MKTPGYTAISISLFCSWSFMDAQRAADLCVCLTEGGAEQHTEQKGKKLAMMKLVLRAGFCRVLTLFTSVLE